MFILINSDFFKFLEKLRARIKIKKIHLVKTGNLFRISKIFNTNIKNLLFFLFPKKNNKIK